MVRKALSTASAATRILAMRKLSLHGCDILNIRNRGQIVLAKCEPILFAKCEPILSAKSEPLLAAKCEEFRLGKCHMNHMGVCHELSLSTLRK